MKSTKPFAVSFVLAAALGACSGSQAPAPGSPEQVHTALCVAAAVRDAGDPRALAPEAVVALAARVVGCLPKAPAAASVDAGSDAGVR